MPATPGDDPSLLASEGFRGDIMDRKDPTRKIGELRYAVMDPLPGHRWALEQPEAWLFLRDGRTVRIRADRGNLYMPDRSKEPEAGKLIGNVLAEVYEAREDGQPIDPRTDKPVATLTTPTLSFDLTLGTASNGDDEPVAVDGFGGSFRGRGLSLVVNQVRERLESLTIAKGDSLVLRTDERPRRKKEAAPPSPAPSATAAATPPAAAPAGPAPAKAAPVETLYHAVFEQNVTVVQGGRMLKADQLHLWSRFIDGQLPPGAIGEVRTEQRAETQKPAAPTPAPRPSLGDPPPTVIAQGPVQPSEGTTGNEITLHWTGPCKIVPLEETPAALAKDHVALRFVSPDAGVVTLTDAEQGASGQAVSIEYGATTRRLTLAGSEATPARFVLGNGRGVETASRIEADLGHGLIHVAGAGVLRDDAEHESRIAWGEQADFTLEVVDGAITNRLRQAVFAGRFEASQLDVATPGEEGPPPAKLSTLEGNFARADFAPTPEIPYNLTRLIVEGQARAGSGPQRLEAEQFDVAFVPDEERRRAVPRVLTAVGGVSARDEASRLWADRLEAQLEAAEKGRVEVGAAHAQGNVRFEDDEERVTARADELRADFGRDAQLGGRRRLVDLMGPEVVLARLNDAGEKQSVISGTQVRLDGVQQGVAVFGAGTFTHREPEKDVRVRWTDGMTFDNGAGVLDCFGNAVAVNAPSPLERDVLEAERLRVEFVPMAEAEAQGLAAQDQRRLLRARAYGSVLERDGGVNARVTSERFVEDSSAPEGRRRVQLQHLEGPTIIADQEKQTLDVPAAGRLVIVDKRESSGEPGAMTPGAPVGTGEARGEALFDWEGSLHVERTTGRMVMTRNVRLTHRNLADRQITNLDCDRLEALGTIAGDSGELRSAVATGAVYVTVGPEAVPGRPRPDRRELVADEVEYNVAERRIAATARPGARVSLFDPARATPVTAAALRWDLAADTITVERPSPIVAPVSSPR